MAIIDIIKTFGKFQLKVVQTLCQNRNSTEKFLGWKMCKKFVLTFVFFFLLLACKPENTSLGTPITVSEQGAFVAQPVIAIDPTNSHHIAVSVLSMKEIECPIGLCSVSNLLYITRDGGKTWNRQEPFKMLRNTADNTLAFGPDVTLYAASNTGRRIVIAVADADDEFSLTSLKFPTTIESPDKPWLTIDPESGKLYLPHTNTFPTTNSQSIQLIMVQSDDKGQSWTQAVPFAQIVSLLKK